MTKLRFGQLTDLASVLFGSKRSSSSAKPLDRLLNPHSFLCSVYRRLFFSGVEQPEREADHWPASRASYTFTLSCAFIVCTVVTLSSLYFTYILPVEGSHFDQLPAILCHFTQILVIVWFYSHCVFYMTNVMQLIQVLYYYQRATCFGRFFRPLSGAYKTVCVALGIAMLSCSLPLVLMGWNCSNLSTPAADSRKAWQYPRLHIEFYKLLMMGKKPSETCSALIIIKNVV